MFIASVICICIASSPKTPVIFLANPGKDSCLFRPCLHMADSLLCARLTPCAPSPDSVHNEASFEAVVFHSTNERSHWIKDNISNPNLNNSILLKNANLNNSILLKSVSYCYFYC